MKIKLAALVAALTLVFSGAAYPCVGKKISIGIERSSDSELLAELLSVLINERTGTTVKVSVYPDARDIYDAVRKGDVGILIENTDHALKVLGKPAEKDAKRALEISKEGFRNRFNLIWLEPFGAVAAGAQGEKFYCPVLTSEVLNNFPALPRVVNKLAGTVTGETLIKMIQSVKSGGNARKVARDFLKAKKLI